MAAPTAIDSLSDCLTRARLLHEGGYTRTRNWNLGQTLKHLSGFMEMSRTGFHGVKAPPGARLLGRPILWYVLKFGMPGGAPAPPLLVFGDHVDDAEALQRFEAEVDLFEKWEAPLAPSPLFGRLDKETWRRVHLIHARHHLQYLLPKSDT